MEMISKRFQVPVTRGRKLRRWVIHHRTVATTNIPNT